MIIVLILFPDYISISFPMTFAYIIVYVLCKIIERPELITTIIIVLIIEIIIIRSTSIYIYFVC